MDAFVPLSLRERGMVRGRSERLRRQPAVAAAVFGTVFQHPWQDSNLQPRD